MPLQCAIQERRSPGRATAVSSTASGTAVTRDSPACRPGRRVQVPPTHGQRPGWRSWRAAARRRQLDVDAEEPARQAVPGGRRRSRHWASAPAHSQAARTPHLIRQTVGRPTGRTLGCRNASSSPPRPCGARSAFAMPSSTAWRRSDHATLVLRRRSRAWARAAGGAFAVGRFAESMVVIGRRGDMRLVYGSRVPDPPIKPRRRGPRRPPRCRGSCGWPRRTSHRT